MNLFGKSVKLVLAVIIFMAFSNSAHAGVLASQPESSSTFTSCLTPLGTGCSNVVDYSSQNFVPLAGILEEFKFSASAPTDYFFVVQFYNVTTGAGGLKYFGPANYVSGKTEGNGAMTDYILHASDFSVPIVFNGTDTWSVQFFAYANRFNCGSLACFHVYDAKGDANYKQYFVINSAEDNSPLPNVCTVNCPPVLASQSDFGSTFLSCLTNSGTDCAGISDYSTQSFVPVTGTLNEFKFSASAPVGNFFAVQFHNATEGGVVKYFGPANYVPGKTEGTGMMTNYTLQASDFSAPIVFNGTDTWTVQFFAYRNSLPCGNISCYNLYSARGDVNHKQYFVITSAPTAPPACVTNCFSNVLFFPGFEGSRLYRQTGFEDCIPTSPISNCIQDSQLWFSTEDDKHETLSLNEHGKSLDTVNIYTKNDTKVTNEGENETGILDEAESVNIYKSFLSDIKDWKDEGIIADYAFIPYDWRLSLEDIISNAKVEGDRLSYTDNQDFSESFILQKLEELQQSSKTGKVTIIAHSNGGLVTKALVQKLKDTNNPLYDKIDKVIFVAVPQIGTPEALISLLHGINLGPGGIVMSNERSRQLSENMPGVYNLIPSASYFTMPQVPFAPEKIVTFPNSQLFNSQIIEYEEDIEDETELKAYVLGSDAREKPEYNETNLPNIGNSFLYQQTQVMHQVLDSWTPSPDTKVIQIAGWGEETIAGLDYKVKKKFLGGEYASYKPRTVIDGDATVVVPSALWMPESANAERWWVDLWEHNDENTPDRDHKNILEVNEIINFIKNEIKNNDNGNQIYDYITNDYLNLSLEDVQGDRLHYTLHSPLTLGVASGIKYTGMDPITKEIKLEIPGVTYKQIGEVQFLSVPAGVPYTLVMHGYEEGSFSLDVDKQEGNDIIEFTSFEGIPSSVSTTATMDISTGFEVGSSVLKIDKNGDGINDINLNARLGEVVLAPYYTFSGFFQPINDITHNPTQSLSVFKGGSTVPVKFQLKNLDGTIVQASSIPAWLTPQRGSMMSASIDESTYSLPATTGTEFKWDPTSQQYIYNWSTKGLASGYWYKLSMKLDDGNVYSVTVGLK